MRRTDRLGRGAAVSGGYRPLCPVYLPYSGLHRPAAGALRPRYAWCCYGAIALLGLLLCPDKEVSLLFCFTGYYPLLKPRLDALRSRLLSLTLKLLWAAASMAALYALILYVFCLPAVVEEFAATGRWLLAATIAMGVALFFVYDVLLGRLMARWPAKV